MSIIELKAVVYSSYREDHGAERGPERSKGAVSRVKIGLQLYSVRDTMEKDMDAALGAVSRAGYDSVEFAGFFGKSADEIKAMLEKYGLEAVSAHIGYEELAENTGGILEMCREIGIKYAAVPYMGPELHKGTDGYDERIDVYKKAAENVKKYGMKLLYHNHDFEFRTYEGKYLNDWLMESVGEENISPEPDVCWIKYGGASPVDYIMKYSGRVPVVHLKDFIGEIDPEKSQEENGFEMRPVGSGCQDWDAILNAAERAGAECLIVEQDHHYGADPFDNVKKSRDFLRSKGY